jgi:hypothetical protein
MRIHRLFAVGFVLGVFVVLSGCGGGGGGSSNAGSAPATSPAPASPASTPSSPPVTSTSPTPTVAQSTTPNVQPISVVATPSNTRNMLVTSVTVCAPGTSNCVTIDNVQVDTGSQGLRLLASQLPASLALPAVAGATTANSVSGECAVFGTGYTWGAVRTADVRMAGQLASSLSIQVISDPALPTVPSDCAASGLPMLTPAALHVNGILAAGDQSRQRFSAR